MKKAVFLIALLATIMSNSFAQTNNTEETINKQAQEYNGRKCKLSVEDILRQQPFDIDHYKSEKAGNITAALIKDINLIYYKEKNHLPGIKTHINSVRNSVKAAKDHGMDLKLLKADLDFVNSIK